LSFFATDIRLLPRLFILVERVADAALVFSFTPLISSPLEKRPRNELPPLGADDGPIISWAFRGGATAAYTNVQRKR